MSQNLGSFRGSNIEYFYNTGISDTAAFKATFKGSKSHLNFVGQMIKIDKKWQLITYFTVSDSLMKLP